MGYSPDSSAEDAGHEAHLFQSTMTFILYLSVSPVFNIGIRKVSSSFPMYNPIISVLSLLRFVISFLATLTSLAGTSSNH